MWWLSMDVHVKAAITAQCSGGDVLTAPQRLP